MEGENTNEPLVSCKSSSVIANAFLS